MKVNHLTGCLGISLLGFVLVAAPCWANRVAPPAVVDMTQDGNAARMAVDPNVASRTFNLGPTGMRGFLFTSGAKITGDARQILVTEVEKGSPADGVMAGGDVIVGLDGKPFSSDARSAFGLAIDVAEGVPQQGLMKLLVSRAGKNLNVALKLKVMGSYSNTAPYDCPKSAKILEEGCRYIAANKDYGRFNFGALALLSSGKPEYLDMVKELAHDIVTDKAAVALIEQVSKGNPMGSAWEGGYGKFFIDEYYLATGDKTVWPYIRAAAINTAMGQGMFGTYGHGFSERGPNGALHSFIAPYGALNQAGGGCFLAMAMARKAGVEDAELNAALKRSEKFFGYYVGKGTIPYGEHPPSFWFHDDNGKDGNPAVAFSLEGNRTAAQFFAKMDTAGFGGREFGHTGPFFGYMWGTPGANVGGPKAAAAYFKQVSWHYDLQRRWDGSFAYDETAGNMAGLDYRGVRPTAIYMFTFALPLRKLVITGKDQKKEMWLSDKDVEEAVEAGNFDPDSKSLEELMKCLGSWSPTVRQKSAEALGKRSEDILPRLTKMAEGDDANARIGATQALGYLKDRAIPALPVLTRLLAHQDRWVRVLAADALKSMGAAARPAANEMLKSVAGKDESDPLEFAQNSLAHALFYPGGAVSGSPGVLAKSIEGIDRKELLYPAIRAVSRNPDGHARGCLASTFKLLNVEDVKVLAPDIIDAMNELAPCNTMFSKGVIVGGIQMMARLQIKEGLPLSLKMLKWDMHGAGYVRQIARGALKQYRGAARELLPELKLLEAEAGRKKQAADAKELATLISLIEADKDPPALVSIKAFLSESQIKRMSTPYRQLKEVTSADLDTEEVARKPAKPAKAPKPVKL